MQRAMIVAGFGTSAAEDGVGRIARALAEAYPGYAVCRATTSGTIRARLRARAEREGMPCAAMDSPAQAIARLRGEGTDEIVVAAAFVVAGQEYEGLCRDAAGLRVAKPLLADEADLCWLSGWLAGVAREEGRTLLLMGHGARGEADEMYARLGEKLPETVWLACVDGARSFEGEMERWIATGRRAVTLMPLMLSAGWHARRELAGEAGWRSRLEARGFDVRVRMQGLGEFAPVQRRFVEKMRDALGR